MDSSIVTLNVGGTHFCTTQKTLMQEPSSKLALIVRGILPSATDDGGHTFIDRDARFFQCILNFLRDGWTLLPTSASERRELMQEARYFQVRRPPASLDPCCRHGRLSIPVPWVRMARACRPLELMLDLTLLLSELARRSVQDWSVLSWRCSASTEL